MPSKICVLVFTLAAAAALHAQEPRTVVPPPMPQEQEQRLATAPPDTQTYSRYRYWLGFQPPSIFRSGWLNDQPLGLYKAYLISQGAGADVAEKQIRLIREQVKQNEVEGWNLTLTADKPIFDTNPNAFLVRMTKDRKLGKALDVGMGQGRNAVWLAQQGWDVTGFDPADRAGALANEIAWPNSQAVSKPTL